MVTIVRKPFAGPKPGEFANDAISFDYDLLSKLIGDNPFPAPDGNRFRGLIIDRDEIDKRIWPVWRCLERWHIDKLIDRHAKISQFAKHGVHQSIFGRIQWKVPLDLAPGKISFSEGKSFK